LLSHHGLEDIFTEHLSRPRLEGSVLPFGKDQGAQHLEAALVARHQGISSVREEMGLGMTKAIINVMYNVHDCAFFGRVTIASSPVESLCT
jgi:hypothetical protein